MGTLRRGVVLGFVALAVISAGVLLIPPAIAPDGHDGEDVIRHLERLGIDRLDYLVTTHADADHTGGHAAIIEYFETEADGVGAIYDPGVAASTATYERYLDGVERNDVTLYEARQGDSIPLENASARILAPPEDRLAGGERNVNSIVLDVQFGNASFLLPGDVGAEGEASLLETFGESLNTTVLKAAHHGSKMSTGEGVLNASRPRVVVISSGYESQYGHPHEEVLDRRANRSIPTYWTATHGTVKVVTDGERVTVVTQQPAPTDARRLKNGTAIEPGNETAVEPRIRLSVGTGNRSTAPVATDGGTADRSNGTLRLVSMHAEAADPERENLNDEFLVFENGGNEPLYLGGRKVSDEADHTYTFPDGYTLDPGVSVTQHTGSGTTSETDLYWGSGQPIWNNGGDTVTVRTPDGERILEEEY